MTDLDKARERIAVLEFAVQSALVAMNVKDEFGLTSGPFRVAYSIARHNLREAMGLNKPGERPVIEARDAWR